MHTHTCVLFHEDKIFTGEENKWKEEQTRERKEQEGTSVYMLHSIGVITSQTKWMNSSVGTYPISL
jgi:hypothetical protein